MSLPQEFLDDAPLREISVERWRSVFTRGGVPDGVALDTLTEDGVVAAFAAPDLPRQYLDFLQVLHDLGTPLGADALHDAAAECGVDRSDWPVEVRELAAELWARSIRRREYARLLVLAMITSHERAASGPRREYASRTPRACENPHQRVRALEDALRPWFVKEQLGDYVEVKLRPEEGGFGLCILHGGRPIARRAVRNGARETIRYQPAQCDTARYDALAGRLRVTSRSERVASEYCTRIGEVLFGDPAFFSTKRVCTLDPLRRAIDAGQLPTPHPRLGILAVRLTDCLWGQDDGFRVRLHGTRTRDCIGRIRQLQFRLDEGRFEDARLDFVFRGARGFDVVRVVIKAPTLIDSKGQLHREEIDEYLTEIGIRLAPEEVVPSEPDDLWALSAGGHLLSRWRRLCGDDTRIVLQSRVLYQSPLDAVESDGERRLVDAVEDAGGELLVAVPTEPGDGLRLAVAPGDLAGYALDGRRLAEQVAGALGCRPSVAVTVIDGCYDLNTLSIGAVSVRPFLVTRQPLVPPGTLAATLARTARPDHAVAIVPEGRAVDPSLPAVAMRRIVPPFDMLIPEIVRALGIEERVPLLDRVPLGTRLVVHVAGNRMWLDKIELTALSPQARALLVTLARDQCTGTSTKTDDLMRRLPGWADGTPSNRAKDARKYTLDCIQKSFVALGAPPPADLKSLIRGAGGVYRLGDGVRAYVE